MACGPGNFLKGGTGLKRVYALVLAAAVTCLPCHQHALAQCQYEVTAIIQGPNCPISGPQPTFAQGMNNHGHIVGYHWDCEFSALDHAFLWTPENGLQPLPKPEGVASTRASGINDHGIIIGSHTFLGQGSWAFVFDPGSGEFKYLPPLHDGAVATSVSTANAINNNGVVAGSRIISEPGVSPVITNAVIWDTNTGEVIDLGVMNGPNSSAVDMNETGEAAGWAGNSVISSNLQAILWADGVGESLGVLPGMATSMAKHINQHSDIVGLSSPLMGTGLHFFWSNHQMVPILPPNGYDLVGTADLNDARQITGHIRVAGTSTFDPFLWQHGEFYELKSLIADLPEQVAISHGSILGNNGLVIAQGALSGKAVAVILTPIDVPFADFNFDCRVNEHDLLELLANWGPASESKIDLTGDGVVNVFDLLLLLASWG